MYIAHSRKMIILEYMILVGIFAIGCLLWELRERNKMLIKSQIELIDGLQKQFLTMATRNDLDTYWESLKSELDRMVRSFQIEADKRHIVMHDRFDDIQRSLLSKTDFEKYQMDLREKESVLQEAQKKIKENRMKTMKIAFGGKEED